MKLFKSLLLCLLIGLFSLPTLALPVNPLANAIPHYAHVANGKIEYFKFGQGSPIVLISGYGSNVSTWDSRFLSALAEYHTVIVFDNRNVGETSIKSSSYTARDLAEDVYHLIQYLHLQKPDVLGISMGGMIAQEYAVLHADKLGNLILINTAIAGGASVAPSDSIKALMFQPPKNKLILYSKALNLFFPASCELPMAVALLRFHFKPINHIESQITATVLHKQQSLLLGWKKNNDAERKLMQLPVPVLILNGGADKVIPPINSEILAKTLPHASLLRWEDGGHAMIYQHPKEIAEAINGFIAKG